MRQLVEGTPPSGREVVAQVAAMLEPSSPSVQWVMPAFFGVCARRECAKHTPPTCSCESVKGAHTVLNPKCVGHSAHMMRESWPEVDAGCEEVYLLPSNRGYTVCQECMAKARSVRAQPDAQKIVWAHTIASCTQGDFPDTDFSPLDALVEATSRVVQTSLADDTHSDGVTSIVMTIWAGASRSLALAPEERERAWNGLVTRLRDLETDTGYRAAAVMRDALSRAVRRRAQSELFEWEQDVARAAGGAAGAAAAPQSPAPRKALAAPIPPIPSPLGLPPRPPAASPGASDAQLEARLAALEDELGRATASAESTAAAAAAVNAADAAEIKQLRDAVARLEATAGAPAAAPVLAVPIAPPQAASELGEALSAERAAVDAARADAARAHAETAALRGSLEAAQARVEALERRAAGAEARAAPAEAAAAVACDGGEDDEVGAASEGASAAQPPSEQLLRAQIGETRAALMRANDECAAALAMAAASEARAAQAQHAAATSEQATCAAVEDAASASSASLAVAKAEVAAVRALGEANEAAASHAEPGSAAEVARLREQLARVRGGLGQNVLEMGRSSARLAQVTPTTLATAPQREPHRTAQRATHRHGPRRRKQRGGRPSRLASSLAPSPCARARARRVSPARPSTDSLAAPPSLRVSSRLRRTACRSLS
jgi:hypothetical protein